jgi:endonuclease III
VPTSKLALPNTKPFAIRTAIARLRKAVAQWKTPIVTEISQQAGDRATANTASGRPFRVLISTILSLRTKDETTRAATNRLLALADSPEAILALDEKMLARTIYPVGFYNQKAKQILAICRRLIDECGGAVPDDLDALLTFPGVGRKTANLVLTRGFMKAGICVDVHVHRISNRWGYVATRSPDETEMALRAKLPRAYWIEYNDLLVTFGQNCCKPVSPHCSTCPLSDICPRLGVERWR